MKKTYVIPKTELVNVAVQQMIAVSTTPSGLDGTVKEEYTGSEEVDW